MSIYKEYPISPKACKLKHSKPSPRLQPFSNWETPISWPNFTIFGLQKKCSDYSIQSEVEFWKASTTKGLCSWTCWNIITNLISTSKFQANHWGSSLVKKETNKNKLGRCADWILSLWYCNTWWQENPNLWQFNATNGLPWHPLLRAIIISSITI